MFAEKFAETITRAKGVLVGHMIFWQTPSLGGGRYPT